MKVWFVAPEVAPFKKTGGLGDVAGALPKALRARGIDVRVVMPLYQGFAWDLLEELEGILEVPMYYGEARFAVRKGSLPGSDVPVYFVEHNGYFDRPHIYGPPEHAYSDNLERFAFFSKASLELARALGFEPDVVHLHDWPTALVSGYLDRLPTVFTIHNLAYQGNFDPGGFFITGLAPELYRPDRFEHFGQINLLKGGLLTSTLLTTVSPTYAREIQTPENGFGLDGVLRARRDDLRGILNGIDASIWNPASDAHLPATFDARRLSGKVLCKRALQNEMGLPERDDVPLYGVIARLTPQKGLDVLAQALGRILEWDLQFVLLGTGEEEAERFFAHLSASRGDRFRARIGFDEGLAHRIEAGADFFVMPSRYEPCGLNQLYSLRYGTLPIVRATGGLADTVRNYDERSGEGTGFVFVDLNPASLADTIGWSLATYRKRPKDIQAMRRSAMKEDFSWDRAAASYETVYAEARKRGS